ncbi:MAG: DUF3189 family protein [Firmicutes bacterium]|nr:DUF3189 family protein [Bacillota bacterium]
MNLKIIYHCYGSSHSSVVAAAIHLGYLPKDRPPTTSELINIPHYDRTMTRDLGTLFFFGRDAQGHEVYILGRKNAEELISNLVPSILKYYGHPPQEILLVNALERLSLLTTVGGTLSRGAGLVSIGRPLTIWGIKRCYFNFVQLVESVQKHIALTLEHNSPTGTGNPR